MRCEHQKFSHVTESYNYNFLNYSYWQQKEALNGIIRICFTLPKNPTIYAMEKLQPSIDFKYEGSYMREVSFLLTADLPRN